MYIYNIYDCDECQSYPSFRFLATCDAEHLDDILKQIKEDHKYSNEEMETYIYIDTVLLNNYK